MEKQKDSVNKDEYYDRVFPYLDKIESYITHGCTEKDIYIAFGIGKTTWFRYKQKHMELTELLCKAKKIAEMELVNLAYKVATGYFIEELVKKEWTDEDGERQTSLTIKNKYIKPDPDMIKFILINRYSDEWKNDPQGIDLRKKLVELQLKIAKEKSEWEGV